MRGRWAWLAAVLVVVFACAAPPKTIASLQSPTPSPSPTPTAPLQASGPGFHVGEVGVGYAPVALSATGGVAPYKWTVSAGSLPAGLTVGPDGSVSGNPTGGGSYAFTIQVADAGNSTATIDGTIGIASHVTASVLGPCAQYCNVELGCVTVCGTFGTLSGGVAPYAYGVTQGTLPAGTSLSTLALTGTFTGQPGYLQFTVQVTDALGATSSISPTFWMRPHISFGGSATCGPVFYRIGCQAQLPYSLGMPNTTPTASITSVSLTYCAYNPQGVLTCTNTSSVPPGFTVNVGSSTVTMIAPAENPPYHTYKGTINIQLADQGVCAANTHCVSDVATLTVDLNGG